jgi:hypothetical protein
MVVSVALIAVLSAINCPNLLNNKCKEKIMVEVVYKRFMLFIYDRYYPGGGVSDCTGSFDTLEEAIAAATNELADVKEILDLDDRKVVWKN